jgi:hypothetical protein
MKSAVSLALSIGLVLSALPVAAQDRVVASSGPLARAIAREAARLTTVQQVGKPTNSDWACVRRLVPGTEVTVTVRGSQPGTRYVVLADEYGVTVLNLTNPTIPPAAKSVLPEVASHHPEYFTAAQKGGTFVLDKNVRMGPDGVFVADRKIADLAELAERIVRDDVVQVEGPTRARGSVAGAVIGAGGGFLVGSTAFVVQALRDDCSGGCSGSNALAVMALVGFPVAGGILGYRISSHETRGVIYRAP